MEQDKNPFPKIDILPGMPAIRHIGHFMNRLVSFLPLDAPDCMSNHYHPNRGAAPTLDAALYDSQPSQEMTLF